CRNLDAADPWKLKKAVMAFWNYQVWDRLAEIAMPVLILKGAKDKLHEPEALVRMESMLKNGRSIDMGTNKRTHSAEIVEWIRQFVRENAAGAG
ncbi:alpha/beta hydrolase, partial [bacterium]|nr:alpha/beta hydrolase [bacterium]